MSGAPDPARAAAVLAGARRSGRLLRPFTDDHPALDDAWAYAVQDADRLARVAAGERVVGAKLGLTSRAKQERMGVDRPIVGFLTDAMLLGTADVPARLAGWTQPRIEPEIVVRTAADLAGEPLHLRGVVAEVGLAAEVIDSRFEGYRFRLPDVVADDTSAAGVVLDPVAAPLRPPDDLDLAALACTVEVDGAIVHRATGAAILGEPLRALAHLLAHVESRGEVLPAGSLVLLGALTDAVPLVAGSSYRLAIEGLGELAVAT